MSNQKTLLPIGVGNVGGAAVVKAQQQLGLKINHIVRSSGVCNYDTGELIGSTDEFFKKWKQDKPDIVFMTIPSFEDGKQAFEYMSFFAGMGVPIVTAEKGALSNFAKKAQSMTDYLGVSATVGGGTRMLSFLQDRMSPSVNQVHVVVNGTLNFILDGVSRGRTLGQVVDEAIKLGYAEPGAESPLDVINGEAVGDVPKKVSILWNFSGMSKKLLDWHDIKQPPLSEEELDSLISDARERRYIVSIYRSDEYRAPLESILGSFHYTIDGWTIVGGFQKITHNPLFRALDMPGPANGMVLATGKNEEDGVYTLSGPGAGPEPTAAAMIQDARKLLNK